MGIMVDSLNKIWVMQDLYHQPYDVRFGPQGQETLVSLRNQFMVRILLMI